LKLPLRQLEQHLSRGTAGIYLVAADEPLLVAEASDAIRAAAREAGFDERQVAHVERGFRWETLSAESDSLSLFASKRIIELRMQAPRPGDAGGRWIRAFAEDRDPDRLLLITANAKLDSSAARSVWVKTIEQNGVVVQIWPIERAELPRWITDRAARLDLELTRAAAELLADRVEGNLLAADQELRKLALAPPGPVIDEAAVLEKVATSSRFDVFRLTDALAAGDAARAVKVLDGLRSDGTAPPLILWAICRELSLLMRLERAQASGQSLDQALGRLRVWRRRHPLLKRALKRLDRARLAALLAHAVRVDRTLKGVERGPIWESVTALVLDCIEPGTTWLDS
jgi:DNA polymerase-3 subunit delta